MRNSLLVAPMPTASTSQILGNNECFEPFTSNLYTRRTLAGDFIVFNKYLLTELMETGLWSDAMKQEIVARNGSVQGIDAIPLEMQARYKTTYELKQKVLIDMAVGRGAFVDQSQSLNLFAADPNYAKLTSMHFYAWKSGLKTGCYYLRTKAPVMAQKFTVDPRLLAAVSGGKPGSSAAAAQAQAEDQEDDYVSDDSDDERQSPKTVEALKKALRAAELEAKAKAAAEARQKLKESGQEHVLDEEVCTSCGS
jgi:ribonucleotide reductase alpha subunit